MAEFRYVDLEAEQHVIGALLDGTEEVPRLIRELELDHFSFKQTKWIFKHVRDEFLNNGTVPTVEQLEHQLWENGARDDVVEDYRSLMLRLLDYSRNHRGSELKHYVVAVKKRRRGRTILDLVRGRNGADGILRLLEDNQIDEAERQIQDWFYRGKKTETISSGGWLGDRQHRMDLVDQMQLEPERFYGIRTGIKFVDQVTSGLLEEELGLIVAETGAGKSTLLCHLAFEAWRQGKNVFFVTIEMPRSAVEFKLDSRLSMMDSNKFRKAFLKDKLSESEKCKWHEDMRRAHRGTKSDVVVADMPDSCTIVDIETHMIEKERQLGIKFDMVCIDYLGLLNPRGNYDKGRLAWDSQTEISQDAKFFCRRHKVRTWTAVQEKMTATKQEKQKGAYGLSYLIPQACDISLLVSPSEEEKGIIGVRIGKYRFGSTGTRKCSIDFSVCKIQEIEDQEGD